MRNVNELCIDDLEPDQDYVVSAKSTLSVPEGLLALAIGQHVRLLVEDSDRYLQRGDERWRVNDSGNSKVSNALFRPVSQDQ